MTEQTVIGLLAAVATLGGAAVTYLTASQARLWKRLGVLEQRERSTWYWARAVVDLYYRHRTQDAPDLPTPPEHITKEEPHA